ncbi:MAG: S8 family serine peptidase [Chloroflexi bacterium]|nr:S8 family serine peptidase [Chloroflexota bacterium]
MTTQNSDQIFAPGRLVISAVDGDASAIYAAARKQFANAGIVVANTAPVPGDADATAFTLTDINGTLIDVPKIRELETQLAEIFANLETRESAFRRTSLSPALVVPAPTGPPSSSTTGGPAGDPRTSSAACEDFQFQLDAATQSYFDQALADKQGRDHSVRVVVLDSSPYGEHPGDFVRHLNDYAFPFVQRFFVNGQPTFHLRRDTLNPTPWGDGPTDMSQHGLFIASIIKSIAPDAYVEVVPVLGKSGEGSLEELTQQIESLQTDFLPKDAQLLVNVSATTMVLANLPEMPTWLDELVTKIQSADERRGIRQTALVEQWHRNGVRAFASENRRIIAAAGNDGAGGERWWPGFPARVEGVLSVGAVDGEGRPAEYSNLCRIPGGLSADATDYLRGVFEVDSNGIYVSGGTQRSGIVGLFLARQFESDPAMRNECGSALWSGTSFATAIATGYMAWLCLQGMTAAEAYQTMLALPATADDGGPILQAEQA